MNFGSIQITNVDALLKNSSIYYLLSSAKTACSCVLYHNKTTTQNIHEEAILIHMDFLQLKGQKDKNCLVLNPALGCQSGSYKVETYLL